MCTKCQILNLSIPPNQLEPELKRIAKLIREGKLRPDQLDAAMVKKIAKQLMAGVNKGYGTASTALDKSFLQMVEDNVFVFSGFKTHAMLREASLMLKDGDTIKPFNQFLNDLKSINKTYNEVYANAEYGNAVASMQSASSFNDYLDNGIEMLTFQSINDDRTRPEHAMMDGTTVPIGDPLLDTYNTPLDWGCRCEWVPAEPSAQRVVKDLPTVPQMFQNNVAKTGIIFPDTHPYFNVKPEIAKAILAQVDEINKIAKVKPVEKPAFYPEALDDYKKKLGIKVNDEIFTILKEPVPLTNKPGNSFYSPTEKKVNLVIDARTKASKWNAESVVYHEYAHAADWQYGWRNNPSVTNLMAKYKKVFEAKGKNNYSKIHNKIIGIYRKAKSTKNADLLEKVAAAGDTLMSLNPKYGYGHAPEYFALKGKKEAEFIAHIFENRFIGNSVFKDLMPDLYEDSIKLANELINQTK